MTVREILLTRPAGLGTSHSQGNVHSQDSFRSQGTFQTQCRDLSAQLASSLGGQPAHAFPQAALDLLRRSGLWEAGLAAQVGGPELTARALLELLRAVGRASLPLGRLFEGHVNALALVSAYGNAEQAQRAAHDVSLGHLYGVWNTEGPDGVRLVRQQGPLQPGGIQSGQLTLQGAKTFASGGLHARGPCCPSRVQRTGNSRCCEPTTLSARCASWKTPGSRWAWPPRSASNSISAAACSCRAT